ncbi:MAG: AraC family protein [Halomonas sp. HL-48]|nr:helix-turn-helix domain-containing protein [Halomonas sp. HL-48]KPQ25541.1 MAG: AraC family protein [Halomonas sp. HL-48]
MVSSNCIPSTCFDSDDFEPQDRFDAWRTNIAPVFDVEPLDKTGMKPFRSRVDVYQLHDIMLGNVFTRSQRFHQAHPSERVDHILVQVHRSGGYKGKLDGEMTHVLPGCVSVIDLARPLDTRSNDTDIINVMLPREHFDRHPAFLDAAHGMVLSSGRGRFLADYLESLMLRLPTIECREASDIADITSNMILACAYHDVEAQQAVSSELDVLARERVKRIIENCLASPQLTPDWLCLKAGLSRANLYRLFSTEGGVVRYIQYRRMARVRRCLEDTKEHRTIGELAEQYGFTSQAHFSRRFKKTFHLLPGEVRHAAQRRALLENGDESPYLSRWLRQLGR